MRRRNFIAGLASTAAAWPVAAPVPLRLLNAADEVIE
jgi:hypothetical protein